MKIGHALRALREQRGLKLESLAVDLGLATSSLSRLERGQIQPRLDTLMRCATVFNVSVSRIIALAEELDEAELRELPPDYARLRAELITHFDGLTPPHQRAVLQLIKSLRP